MQWHIFNPWIEKIPWKRKWQPSLVFFPGKYHGQRSLAGYSPWGHRRVGHDLATKQQQCSNSHYMLLTSINFSQTTVNLVNLLNCFDGISKWFKKVSSYANMGIEYGHMHTNAKQLLAHRICSKHWINFSARLICVCWRQTCQYWEVKVLHNCVWLFATPLGFSVRGILYARIPEWVAIPFSRESPGI